MPLDHLAEIRGTARILGLAAIVAAADGDPDAAGKYLWAILRMANHLASESIFISQLVRMSAVAIAYDWLQDVSRIGAVSQAWLDRIDQELRFCADPQAWSDLTLERMLTLGMMERILKGEMPWAEDSCPNPFMHERFVDWLLFDNRLLGPPVLKMNLIKYLEFSAALDESYRDPDSEPPGALEQFWAYENKGWPRHYSVTEALLMLPLACRYRINVARARAKAMLARLGLALIAYKEEVGSYPEDLGALPAELTHEAPVDLFTGEPFEFTYRKEGEGFLLYSVGFDDDGGRCEWRKGHP